ncbi:unnamed protein product [Rhodiola kirilowii]
MTFMRWSCPYRCNVHCFLVGRKCSRHSTILGSNCACLLIKSHGWPNSLWYWISPVFYGAKYVPLAQWWGYGFIISVVNLVIWLGVGGAWWKFLGLW